MQNGTQTQTLNDEQRRLVVDNLGLARKAAWKWLKQCERYGLDWDDAFSIASMGLMKAARLYDPQISATSSYLFTGCENAILMALRSCRAECRHSEQTVYLSDYVKIRFYNLATSDLLSYADVLPSKESTDDTVEQRLNIQAIYAAISTFSPRDRTMLKLYMDGIPQREISQIVGCSQGNVSKSLKKCRSRLKEVIQ